MVQFFHFDAVNTTANTSRLSNLPENSFFLNFLHTARQIRHWKAVNSDISAISGADTDTDFRRNWAESNGFR
jgi:hypothetical protein